MGLWGTRIDGLEEIPLPVKEIFNCPVSRSADNRRVMEDEFHQGDNMTLRVGRQCPLF